MRGVAETVQRRSRGEGSLRCAGKRDLLETGERLGERHRGPGLVDRRLEGPFGELVAIDQRPVDHLLLSRGVAWKGGGGERGMDWEERIEGNWERDAPWDSSEGTGTAEGCICLEMSVSSEDDSTVGFLGDARGSDSLGEDCFSFAVEKGIQLNGMEELDCASP